MNRIFTLVIASTLTITGSNIFAQQLPRSPRPVQHTEVIQYATERASEVPNYRGYRKSNIYVAPKPTRTFAQRSYPNVKKKSSFAISPRSPRQTIEAAPKIYSYSRRVIRSTVPTPATEIAVSTPDPIGPAETQMEAITISSPVEQPKATVAAPMIPSSSRRITRSTVPTPVTEIAVSTPDPIEQAETQSEAIAISSPVEQPETTVAAPVIPSSSRRITRSTVPTPVTEIAVSTPDPIEPAETQMEAIALSSPVEQPKTTEAAPVIPSSSQRITRSTVPTPATEIAVSAPDPIEPAETQIDVVRTGTPAKASPDFKYRSPSDYSPEELQLSQWEPRPKQVQSEEAIAVSSPVEQPWTIDLTDPFETVTPAVSTDNKVDAVPLKSALLGSEESPFTSFIAETDRRPAVETGYSAEAVDPIAFATTGLTTEADLQKANKVHTFAGKETSHQKTAAEAWWVVPALLVLPLLALLGWTMFGRERYEYRQYYKSYQHHQFEVAPAMDIPQQSNTPWQSQESTDAELSSPVASETDPQEIHCLDEGSVATEAETELLDEIHSIHSIAFDSTSAARSTSNSRAKSKNN